jgi:hypothetical protein
MKIDQRYISSELSHFVGRRSLVDVQQQYTILKTILETGRIAYDPGAPQTNGIRSKGLLGNLNGSFVSNTMYRPKMVCFCDIPASDLAIHTNKYGVCGLSFSKEFLVEKGAIPVFYVTEKAAAEFDGPAVMFERLVDAIRRCDLNNLPPELQGFLKSSSGNPSLVEQVKYFIHFNIFSYIQCFNYSLSDENEQNYYFEREWRSLYDVKFSLSDVLRVFMPEAMSKQFLSDFPDYYGQITFTKSESA